MREKVAPKRKVAPARPSFKVCVVYVSLRDIMCVYVCMYVYSVCVNTYIYVCVCV